MKESNLTPAWAVEVLDDNGYHIVDVFNSQKKASDRAQELDGNIVYYEHWDWLECITPYET
jgi:hypothetical protein